MFFQLLEDNVYLKRHMKLELDEKRRKRYKHPHGFRTGTPRRRWLVGGSKRGTELLLLLNPQMGHSANQRAAHVPTIAAAHEQEEGHHGGGARAFVLLPRH